MQRLEVVEIVHELWQLFLSLLQEAWDIIIRGEVFFSIDFLETRKDRYHKAYLAFEQYLWANAVSNVY